MNFIELFRVAERPGARERRSREDTESHGKFLFKAKKKSNILKFHDYDRHISKIISPTPPNSPNSPKIEKY